MTTVTAYAPGRVNLIGDHTDYTGGLVLPLAIDRGTTVTFTRGGEFVELTSDDDPNPARVPLTVENAADCQPAWARYVGGVVAVLRPPNGGRGHVRSTLPVGAGLSSTAALEVAVALALGATGPAVDVARLCQAAEHAASGVPCGVMDQLASTAGVAGHALMIDCETLEVTPVPIPSAAAVVVVPSGETRALVQSEYATRRSECEAAASVVGPLSAATAAALDAIADDAVRRRARHVVTENQRVRTVVVALTLGDLAAAGAAMLDSHRSLRDDFEVSTRALDTLVDELAGHRAVYGSRLTGAGFGGCAVALVEARCAAAVADEFGGFVVEASAGAWCR